jgi:hypothetical protein
VANMQIGSENFIFDASAMKKQEKMLATFAPSNYFSSFYNNSAIQSGLWSPVLSAGAGESGELVKCCAQIVLKLFFRRVTVSHPWRGLAWTGQRRKILVGLSARISPS